MKIKTDTPPWRLVRKSSQCLVTVFVLSTSIHGQVLNLGEASSFGILGLNQGSISINSATSIVGDVGYSDGLVSLTNQKAENFDGGAYVHSGANFAYESKNFLPTDGIITGPATDSRLDQANSDSLAASILLNAFSANQTYGALGDNDNLVLNSTGQLNVIDIASLNYNSDTITLNSRSGFDDTFVLRIDGDFDFSQSAVQLNGITAANVIFFFPNPSTISINKANSQFFGTIFAPTGSVDYHNPATFEGAIVAKNITLHSDFNLINKPFNSQVPEPAGAMFLMMVALFHIGRRCRGK